MKTSKKPIIANHSNVNQQKSENVKQLDDTQKEVIKKIASILVDMVIEEQKTLKTQQI